MANIGIIATGKNGYTINLDANDWTALSVNGTTVTASPVDGTYSYSLDTPGPLQFVASASGLTADSTGQAMILIGPEHTHLAVLQSTPGAPLQVNGTLIHLADWPQGCTSALAGLGPLLFSQPNMTGTFSV
ncbi:MAG TPA: hypothetical protein VGQ46_20810 [Thermoanaerobaculia bacterium]|jgi:hypothetical protein|nr:hypothetical protein [Thermoanaerobaculia bacterium]